MSMAPNFPDLISNTTSLCCQENTVQEILQSCIGYAFTFSTVFQQQRHFKLLSLPRCMIHPTENPLWNSLYEKNIEKPSHRPKVRHYDINHADWLLLIPPSCSLLNVRLPPEDFVKFYMKESLHLRQKQLPPHAGFHPQFWNITDFTHFCVSPSNYFPNVQ